MAAKIGDPRFDRKLFETYRRELRSAHWGAKQKLRRAWPAAFIATKLAAICIFLVLAEHC
jgi:hypothetical protein